MNLYFKPYPCCRWAHPAIDACIGIMREQGITWQEIEHVTVKTFKRATLLSKIEPKTADEAQYNIAYPVAASIVYGDFGIDRVMDGAFSDADVLGMMKRLSFEVDADLDAKFPEKRICRAEITLKNGEKFVSADCEPRGEAHEKIDTGWLVDKFYRITAPIISKEAADRTLGLILGNVETPVRKIVDTVNDGLFRKI